MQLPLGYLARRLASALRAALRCLCQATFLRLFMRAPSKNEPIGGSDAGCCWRPRPLSHDSLVPLSPWLKSGLTTCSAKLDPIYL